MKKILFDYRIPDFERYTNDQQFVNVTDALLKIETDQGGLTPEELWEHAINLLESLKYVPRAEITVKRMFSYIIDEMRKQSLGRTDKQIMHSAYCIMFCAVYILCANDEEPDPNQDIIDSICNVLVKMPDIVHLFQLVEKTEDEQEAKGYSVKPHNVLAKPHEETAKEAAVRIMAILKQDIIEPIINANYVQPPFKKEFVCIWEDILANDALLELMRKEEFGKTYNLKLVLNILGLMTMGQKVLKVAKSKLAKELFPDGPTHDKYFTTETEGTFSAFTSSEEQTWIKNIIEKHKN
jgi:hypothetical protein